MTVSKPSKERGTCDKVARTMRLVLATLALAAAASPAFAQASFGRLTIVAPAAPGGGWDQLAREMQRELTDQHLAAPVDVENVPGAAGTIGLAQFINGRREDGRALLVNGLVMVGAILWNESPVSITQTTPIARLVGEDEVIAVPASSPHRDMQGLIRALRDNPAAVSWAGGSAGGTDHILAGLVVAAAGLDPRRTNYIAFSGGGEAVAALLGGQVTAGISGYSEFAPYVEAGRLRVIGISAAARSPIVDAPTLVEQGVDVELANWRAVVAPPGLRPSDRDALTGLVEKMAHTDSWRARLARLGWTDAYLAGPAFERFLDAERIRVARIVSRLRGPVGSTDAAQVGEWVFPVLVLGGAAWIIIALIVDERAARSRRGAVPAEARAGHSGPPLRVALGLGAFLVLLDAVGFIAAGALLFACTASAFGSRRWLRDGLVGAAVCAVVYVAFTRGLGIQLP
jgi:putative tricarboxylic transport membrane protein